MRAKATKARAAHQMDRRAAALSAGLAEVRVRVEQEADRVRPADIRRLCGDPSRLRAATGWAPEIPLERTLADMLAFAREAERERVVS
jgi:GDP-4-dehydro-6-deoxy-D-mannose reductase